MARDVHQLLTKLRRLGWTIEQRRRSSHYLVRSPEGKTCVLSCTPSDRRALLNDRARLRRLGADI